MPQPNIILLLSDQHNPRVTGYEGDPHVRTPHLDAMAAAGVQLRNCYCGSPLCVPSRMAMLSGLLPDRTGVYCNKQSLPHDTPTFVHSLATAGYDAVLCGRMHFIGPDQRHGYTHRLVGDVTAVRHGIPNGALGALTGTLGQHRKVIEKSGPGYSSVLAYDQAVTAAAVHWLDKRDDDKPFFLTVGWYGPHCSYVCPRDLFDRYMDVLPPPDGAGAAMHPAMRKWLENRDMLSPDPEAVRRARAAYWGMVELTDGHVGTMLDAIDTTIGRDNTIVIYASDHGDMAGQHGMFWKSSFYDGSARVPLLWTTSGGGAPMAAGRVIAGVTSLLDLGPTLIDFAAAAPLPECDGQGLRAVLEGRDDIDPDRTVLSLLGDVKGDAPSAMVRRGDWKLIEHHGHEAPQLFNIAADPDEEHDLGRDPATAAVRQELSAALRARGWDGDRVTAHLTRVQAQARVLSAWNQAVPPSDQEEQWQGDPTHNYIEDIPVAATPGAQP